MVVACFGLLQVARAIKSAPELLELVDIRIQEHRLDNEGAVYVVVFFLFGDIFIAAK